MDELPDSPLPSDEFGAHTNRFGGRYIRGASYDILTKLRVGDAIRRAEREGGRVVVSRIAESCCVSNKFVNKIQFELFTRGRVLHPKEVKQIIKARRKASGDDGVGSRSIDNVDRYVLLQLYLKEPHRTLQSYQDWLTYYTGSRPSRSTISNYFLRAFPHRAGFVKPNLVPYDKFKIENVIRAYEYIEILLDIDPFRLVFADEKLLKGQEPFLRNVRVNPETGERPAMNPDPDFRNTHSITGFCSIDPTKPPVVFRIHEGNNDAEQFAMDVELAIISGYIRPGDILVLDNAAYHVGRENVVLEDWLWNNHGIFLLMLPPRAPEWNPIELVWAILVRRLRTCNLTELRERYGNNAAANMSVDILNVITQEEVFKCFEHCYKILCEREYLN